MDHSRGNSFSQTLWRGIEQNFYQGVQQGQLQYERDHGSSDLHNNRYNDRVSYSWSQNQGYSNYTSYDSQRYPGNYPGNSRHHPQSPVDFSRDISWNDTSDSNNSNRNNSQSTIPSVLDIETSDAKSNKPEQNTNSKEPGKEESMNAHSLELSLKASNIISNILKGQKAPPLIPADKSNTQKGQEDLVEKAKVLCRGIRAQRELAKEKQDTVRKGSYDTGSDRQDKLVHALSRKELSDNRPTRKGRNELGAARKERSDSESSGYRKKIGSVQKTSTPNSSLSSVRHMTPMVSTVTSCSSSEVSLARNIPSRTSVDSPQRAQHMIPKSKSLPLKDSVLKMLKYPKSRRGTATIDKLLKTKVPEASRLRLMNLMKPLADTDNQNMDFTQLDPDVQENILHLLDEINSDDYISLSDDDKPDMGSPPYRSPRHNVTTVPLTSRRISASASTSEVISIPDVSHHFNNLIHDDDLEELIPPDDDLQDLLNSAGFDNLNELCRSDDPNPNTGNQESTHRFPRSMNEGLRIVDRVLGEKSAKVTKESVQPSASSASEQLPRKSNADIKQEKILADAAKESVSLSSKSQERVAESQQESSAPSSTQQPPPLGINEAQIICIKPEPSDPDYNTFNKTNHNPEAVSDHSAHGTSLHRDTETFPRTSFSDDHAAVSDHEACIVSMETDDDVKSVGSKGGSKRARDSPVSESHIL